MMTNLHRLTYNLRRDMKKIAVGLAGMLLAGCSLPGRLVYNPPFFGDPVGSIRVIEDKETGLLFVKSVHGTGNATVEVLTSKQGKWRLQGQDK